MSATKVENSGDIVLFFQCCKSCRWKMGKRPGAEDDVRGEKEERRVGKSVDQV